MAPLLPHNCPPSDVRSTPELKDGQVAKRFTVNDSCSVTLIGVSCFYFNAECLLVFGAFKIENIRGFSYIFEMFNYIWFNAFAIWKLSYKCKLCSVGRPCSMHQLCFIFCEECVFRVIQVQNFYAKILVWKDRLLMHARKQFRVIVQTAHQ